MDNLTDAQFEAAEVRGRAALETEPRATAARHNHMTGCVTVDLINGCTWVLPSHLVQNSSDTGVDDLDTIEVDGVGFSLHWPKLDADHCVPALVAGVFGTGDRLSKASARQARQPRQHAKLAAARANGARGGRAKKPG